MQNAASQDMHFPIMGFGVEGRGWKIGQKLECWHWPACCTKDYCPSVNAVADYIKEAMSVGGPVRIDTGFPYGDDAHPYDKDLCTYKPPSESNQNNVSLGHHPNCDTVGIGHGIKISGVKRKDLFVTVKCGFAGPMGHEDVQIKSLIEHLDIGYADLCLMHQPDQDLSKSHGQYGNCSCNTKGKDYDPHKCRMCTYRSMVDNWKAGRCKAIGVNNWNVSNLKEIEQAGLPLPSVVQYKFYLHQSTASSIQSDLVNYTKAKGIIFNGVAPLGVPDWVTFDVWDNMAPTLFDEPLVKKIANKTGKTAAQVMLRWVIQQGVATQARTLKVAHMKQNLDIFNWTLSSEDMAALSTMPQCNITRGNVTSAGDPNYGSSSHNVIGITKHC